MTIPSGRLRVKQELGNNCYQSSDNTKLPQNRQPIAKKKTRQTEHCTNAHKNDKRTHFKTAWGALAASTKGSHCRVKHKWKKLRTTRNAMQHFFATQTVPRTYVWHNRLTTDFVAITFLQSSVTKILSVKDFNRSFQGTERGRKENPSHRRSTSPTFFFSTSENHSQFSFLLAEQGKRNMRSNTTAEYDSRWQLAYVQKPKPLPGPCQPSHLQK